MPKAVCALLQPTHPDCRWFVILATGYAKAHGLFPDPEVALQYKDWGGLAQIGAGQYISNERAIIMIAHIHFLAVSACAAFGPQILGDSLTLLEGEEDEVRWISGCAPVLLKCLVFYDGVLVASFMTLMRCAAA